jgi:PAS domain S-box-containing protein
MKKQTNNADQDKKYLQALKESDERFRSIVLWNPDAIIVTDVEGKIEYMNPTAEKVFNRKLESFVGKDFGLAIVNGESTEIDIVRPGKDTGVGEMYVVETEWLGEKAHLITIRDITDRKRAADELKESENKYRLLADNVHDVIFVLDMNFNYTYVSPSTKILRGYEPEEVMKQPPSKALTPSSWDLVTKTIAEAMELEKEHRAINTSWTLQLEMMRKDGTTVWTEVNISVIRNENQQPVGILGITRDITERKRADEMLRESERQYHEFFTTSRDCVFITSMEGKWIDFNDAALEIFGYDSREELSQVHLASLYVNLEERSMLMALIEKQGYVKEHPVQLKRRDGAVIDALITSGFRQNTDGFEKEYFGTIRDITDRKKAEEALRESENKYRLLANNVHDVIFVLDMNLKYTYISPSVKILRGYEPEELLQQTPAGMLTPSSMDLAMKTIAETMELEKTEHREINVSRTLQLEMIRKDGTTVWTEVKFSLIRDENQQLVNIMGVTRDITERKQAERALLESEEKYRLVVENAKESIIITQDMKLVFVNNAAISMVGYSKEILTLKSFTDFIHPDDLKMVVDYHIKRIKGEEVPPVYSFRVIGQDGTVIWCELNAAVIQWKGKPATLNFLNNITERRKSEEELKQTLESLRKSIGATIQTMVSAVEMRDPYTAGHQLRVADLACSIAAEIGLPQDKIDGIRMAGSIHDIGKLSIPAEILSKPTKLTDIEFSLIKEHSRSGYEMLKDVESPWPLAQIVYQHHERMNGSGYPRNLKGKEILIEARIMAVADVVEAIASHRPYRPGLGIEVALEEIEKNKGIFYDDAVADACLRLFREKGYQLI